MMCMLTQVMVSLVLLWTLPQSLSKMMMSCLSMTMSMVVASVSAPLHLSGTLAKSPKLAIYVESLTIGLRTAMLTFD